MPRSRVVRYLAVALAGIVALAAAVVYGVLRASLPRVDGALSASGLAAAAVIERDALGTPTIRGASRRDVAFATGIAHAQDRFFQMDLMRRAAAGELAALLGAAVLETDRQHRRHDFRRVAIEVVRRASAVEQEILAAYAAGVNAALAGADSRPWEYLLLRSEPAPWRAEDSILVAFAMYLTLNDASGEEELARGQLRESLPPALFAFLHPLGTEWDAPVLGGTWRAPPIPGAEVLDLRSGSARAVALSVPRSHGALEQKAFVGSNSWAVAARHTADGAALLANDMHLGLRLPHIWYRARLIVSASSEPLRDLVGVTLPGLPMLIVGSNGKVAWSFTNSYGDWTDLVVVEPDPGDARRYLTAAGSEPFTLRAETIEVSGAKPVQVVVKGTRWGPIVNQDAQGRPLALSWTAHHPQATNVHMLAFEVAGDVEQLLAAANRAGVPVQNFTAVDAAGHIGWTLMGQVPVRGNYDSTVPASWRAPDTGWTGWRAEQEYPRIVDPPSGRLWTANARTLDAETWLAFLGDGGYDLGARAAQIRDGLLALPSATVEDMRALQLDDRALFLARWRDLLLELLDQSAIADSATRVQARQLIERWSGRALPDDAGYRIVRALRLQILSDVFESLTAAARARFPQTRFTPSQQFEGALWQMMMQRPAHLLDPRYETWNAALLGSVDRALAKLVAQCGALPECTWGDFNTLRMRHPLASVLPFASRWLDMPAARLPGDAAMPRVQGAAFGASERLVVSPGREALGFLQMPGGPVDHPLSPFYGAGHAAWVKGEPTPLLPGATAHTLHLLPGDRR